MGLVNMLDFQKECSLVHLLQVKQKKMALSSLVTKWKRNLWTVKLMGSPMKSLFFLRQIRKVKQKTEMLYSRSYSVKDTQEKMKMKKRKKRKKLPKDAPVGEAVIG